MYVIPMEKRRPYSYYTSVRGEILLKYWNFYYFFESVIWDPLRYKWKQIEKLTNDINNTDSIENFGIYVWKILSPCYMLRRISTLFLSFLTGCSDNFLLDLFCRGTNLKINLRLEHNFNYRILEPLCAEIGGTNTFYTNEGYIDANRRTSRVKYRSNLQRFRTVSCFETLYTHFP